MFGHLNLNAGLQAKSAFIHLSGLSCHYAISPPDWIELAIAASRCHGYETLDDHDENADMPTAPRQPRYRNITSNGSLDLPPNLRDIFLEFEQLYENTKYKRLNGYERSCSHNIGQTYKRLSLNVVAF